jgi:hypothetical protein
VLTNVESRFGSVIGAHGHLHDPRAELARQEQRLDVERERAHASHCEDPVGEIAAKDLEPALGVADGGQDECPPRDLHKAPRDET